MIHSLTQCSTLIVDDFQEMHTLLRSFIKTMGVKTIDDAFSAKDALSLLSSKKFDVVICDYNLGPGKKRAANPGRGKAAQIHRVLDDLDYGHSRKNHGHVHVCRRNKTG